MILYLSFLPYSFFTDPPPLPCVPHPEQKLASSASHCSRSRRSFSFSLRIASAPARLIAVPVLSKYWRVPLKNRTIGRSMRGGCPFGSRTKVTPLSPCRASSFSQLLPSSICSNRLSSASVLSGSGNSSRFKSSFANPIFSGRATQKSGCTGKGLPIHCNTGSEGYLSGTVSDDAGGSCKIGQNKSCAIC